jgi:hypothetical protein
VISHGALASESRLSRCSPARARGARDGLLREPASDRALAEPARHLCARLERCGRAVAGVRVETLDAFAAAISRAAESRVPIAISGARSRTARLTARSLGALKHGYAAAITS